VIYKNIQEEKAMSTKFRYTIEIIPESDGVGYYVTVPSLPGCFSQGKTIGKPKKMPRRLLPFILNPIKTKD